MLDSYGLQATSLGREQLPSGSCPVVDFSMPRNIRQSSTRISYHELIMRRVSSAVGGRSHYIYAGSISSLDPVVSQYGKLKRLVEDDVKSRGGSVLRLGLVVDFERPGGRFSNLIQILDRLPIAVVPSFNCFQLYVTSPEGMVQSIVQLAKHHTGVSDYLCHDTREGSLGELVGTYWRLKDRPYRVMPVLLSSLLLHTVRYLPHAKFDPLRALTVRRIVDGLPTI
jgi:hypothetical protein